MKKRDPRVPPLRTVVRSYPEPADAGRLWNELECGHTAPQTDTEGQGKRQRCELCKRDALRRVEKG